MPHFPSNTENSLTVNLVRQATATPTTETCLPNRIYKSVWMAIQNQPILREPSISSEDQNLLDGGSKSYKLTLLLAYSLHPVLQQRGWNRELWEQVSMRYLLPDILTTRVIRWTQRVIMTLPQLYREKEVPEFSTPPFFKLNSATGITFLYFKHHCRLSWCMGGQSPERHGTEKIQKRGSDSI